MESKFTPGPWKLEPSRDGDFLGVYPDTGNAEFPVATMPDYVRQEVNLANATLIAAAPDLLEALESIDGEAPAEEPRLCATVGFTSHFRDPDVESYVNEIIQEAFHEGVTRGLWEAADIARAAISKARGNQS